MILTAFIGTLCGDQLYFLLGRYYGRRWLLRRPRWQAQTERLDRLMQRWGVLLILVFRFMYGVRTAAVLVFGMSGVSIAKFAALNALGALIWASTVASMGYAFGHGLDWFVHADARQRLMVIAVVALLALSLWTYCVHHLPDAAPRRSTSGGVAARAASRRTRAPLPSERK